MYKKKVIAAFLTGFMLFSLASCNKKVEETTAATTLAQQRKLPRRLQNR